MRTTFRVKKSRVLFVEAIQAILDPMEVGWMEVLELENLARETMDAIVSGMYQRGLCLAERIDGYFVCTNTTENRKPYLFIVRSHMDPKGDKTVFYKTGNDEKCDQVVAALMEEYLPTEIAPEMFETIRKDLRKVVLIFFSDMKARLGCPCQETIKEKID